MQMFDEFFKKEMERMRRMMREMMNENVEEIRRLMEEGKLEGDWEFEPIEDEHVRGFTFRGTWKSPGGKGFRSRKPQIREVSKKEREALTEAYVEEDKVKVYSELPGVDKEEVQINATESKVEIKAEPFYGSVDLPKAVDPDSAEAAYRNGVLEIAFDPKEDEEEEKGKTIKLD